MESNFALVVSFWVITFAIILIITGYIAIMLATLITDYKDKQFKISVKIAICLSLLLYSFIFVKVYYGIAPEYSIGERIGYIIKLSEKGLIWKTFEGEMQLGHGRQAAIQYPFEFCVAKDNQKLIEEIARYERSGKKVRIKYRQYWTAPAVKCESDYEIVQIEALE